MAGSREGEIPVYTEPGSGAQWRVSRWELERLYLYLKVTSDISAGAVEGATMIIESPRILDNFARMGSEPGFRLLEADSICVSVLRLLSSARGASAAWGPGAAGAPRGSKPFGLRADALKYATKAALSAGDGLECWKYRREHAGVCDGDWSFSRESGRVVLLELVRLARREGAIGPFERIVMEEAASQLGEVPALLDRIEKVALMEDEALSLAVKIAAFKEGA
ncbi:MAG: hypothetical protein LBQ12_03550 [Deltaproteobacteria bacterium]|nr:hypothetical protein [Deltaproteobacteria bacterium]